MKRRRAENPFPPVITPEEHAQNAEQLRKVRKGLGWGGLALIGVTAGIDLLNGTQTTHEIKDFLVYLPSTLGVGALICIPGLNVAIQDEVQQSRPRSGESFS